MLSNLMSLSEIRCTTVCGSCAPMWGTDYNQSITDTTDLNLCLKHAACLQSQFLPTRQDTNPTIGKTKELSKNVRNEAVDLHKTSKNTEDCRGLPTWQWLPTYCQGNKGAAEPVSRPRYSGGSWTFLLFSSSQENYRSFYKEGGTNSFLRCVQTWWPVTAVLRKNRFSIKC